MPEKGKNFSRRDFIKMTGAMGIGSIAASIGKPSGAFGKSVLGEPKLIKVPTRPFGKTGIHVPILALGGSQDLMSKQILLPQAFKMGVTYWDTAYRYERGNSEKAIGKYILKYPEDRKEIFLVTKAHSSDPSRMTQYLNKSLERLQTSYVDMFFIHQVSNVKDDINPETKKWVEKAKSKGKIRLFGFSTHENMGQCLLDGAELGWIDGIMTSYNYRLMNTDSIKKGVEACVKAGIGLTAMKTMAKSFYYDVGRESERSSKVTDQFTKRGFTPEQAKLKVVWENENIASICSEMQNMTMLKANVAATLGKNDLTFRDKQLLEKHARETAFGYCAGCTNNCESAVQEKVPIGDIMRYLMYYYGYGNRGQAKRLFSNINAMTHDLLENVDYTEAANRCPQKIPIDKLMRHAVRTFSDSSST